MSAETQPDPILPNYNPSSWDVPTLSPEERAILDTEYITFPIAQNQNITFPVSPTAPTLANGTNTEQVATTGFVQNAIAVFLNTINNWTGTQIFSVGMTSNTINPTTSGTLNIGNAAIDTNVEIATSVGRTAILHLGDGDEAEGAVHINNGLTTSGNVQILNGAGSTGTITLGSATSTISLGCPLTPNYATLYSATGTGGGKIGEIITGTNIALGVTANTPKTISSIDLPRGIWLLYGVAQAGGNSIFFTLSFGTTTNSITVGVEAIDSCPVSGLGVSQTLAYPIVAPAPVSPATATTYYFVASLGTTQTLTAVFYFATRIA